MKKYYIALLTTVVLIISATLTFVVTTNINNTNQDSEADNQTSKSQISPTSASTSVASSTETTDNLTTYTSEILGIKFKYDADRFNLTDYDDLLSLSITDNDFIYIRIGDIKHFPKNEIEQNNIGEIPNIILLGKEYKSIGKIIFLDEDFIGQTYVYQTDESGLFITIGTGSLVDYDTSNEAVQEGIRIIKSIERI